MAGLARKGTAATGVGSAGSERWPLASRVSEGQWHSSSSLGGHCCSSNAALGISAASLPSGMLWGCAQCTRGWWQPFRPGAICFGCHGASLGQASCVLGSISGLG